MPDPMVSIIIPVYNGSNYMRDAIDSALAQTYRNFEVIVVNDGSNDDGKTEEIALSYGDKIRYFSKENGGVATALNLGIEKMRGEYFSWLSHDDLYYPNKLEAQIEALRVHGDWTSVVYGDFDTLDMVSGTKAATHFEEWFPLKSLEESIFPVLCGFIHGCALLIHKSHFSRVGMFDERLITSQDYDLWFRMFRGQKLVFIPQRLICGRCHPERGTNTIPCYHKESENFYYNALNTISEEEIYGVFGHPAVMYYQIAWGLVGHGRIEAYRDIMNRYRSMTIRESAAQRMNRFLSWFHDLRRSARNLCVFGCGDYGKRLRFMLSDAGISVDYFSDNNPRLWGQTVEGVPCISPEALRKIREDTLILIAMQSPEPVREQLRQMRCPHVAAKQTLDKMMADAFTNAWETSVSETDSKIL